MTLIFVGPSPVRLTVNPSIAGLLTPGALGHLMRLMNTLLTCNLCRQDTSTIFPSAYCCGSRSNSTIIRFMRVENFRWGVLSLCRILATYFDSVRWKVWMNISQLASNNLPSILNCQAGIPSPVSKLGAVVASPEAFCHNWPETVWLRKIRNVRVVCVQEALRIRSVNQNIQYLLSEFAQEHPESRPASASWSNPTFFPSPASPGTFSNPLQMKGFVECH